jgi:hypothetical protein
MGEIQFPALTQFYFGRSHNFQTRSAMFVSMRWKKNNPPSNTTPTPTADAVIATPGGCP